MPRPGCRRSLVFIAALPALVGLIVGPVGAGDEVLHPKWSRPVQLSNTEYLPANRPVLHGDGDRMLAAWSTEGRVYGRWSEDGGTSWGERTSIGVGLAPSVAVSDTGATVAWWREGTIYTSGYDGTTWSPRHRLSRVGQACSYPAIYLTGDVVGVVYWRCRAPGDAWQISHHRSTDRGAFCGEGEMLQRRADPGAGSVPGDPPAAAAYGDQVYLAADVPIAGSRSAIYVHSSGDAGATWSRYQVYRSRLVLDSPRLAAYGNRMYLMWRQWDRTQTKPAIRFMHCREGGATCWEPTTLAISAGFRSWIPESIAAFGGQVRAGFSDNGMYLAYRSATDHGAVWLRRYFLMPNPSGGHHWRMWADSSGTHTVWQSYGMGERVYYNYGPWSLSQ